MPALPSPTPRAFPQARAQRTYEALLLAAREVFSQRGYDGAQTPEIAAQAGVSVGTFYRYFTDKRQAFLEVVGGHLAEAHVDVMSRLQPSHFAGRDPRGIVDGVIDVLFEQVARFPTLQEVFVAMSLRDPEVAALRGAFEAQATGELAEVIRALVPRERIADPRAAAYVIQRAAVDTAMARAIDRSATAAEDQAVRRALSEMIGRYLFADGEKGNEEEKPLTRWGATARGRGGPAGRRR